MTLKCYVKVPTLVVSMVERDNTVFFLFITHSMHHKFVRYYTLVFLKMLPVLLHGAGGEEGSRDDEALPRSEMAE